MQILKLCGLALAIAAPVGAVQAERLFGLTANNLVVTFDSANPGLTTSSGAISGILTGDVLGGIDQRPLTRTLYSVATSGNLYQITKDASGRGYTAALIGDVGTPSGSRFGIDFNPVPDRIRFVSDFDQNLRINPVTAVALVDGTIDAPGAEALVGAAYTNSRPGVTSTVLYALDASGNQLLRSTNPNAGTYVDTNFAGVSFGTLGAGIDLGGLNNVGFDISGATGAAFFSNGSTLYSLNLTTGQATSIGAIGSGSLVGLTAGAVPEPTTWAMFILGFGATGVALRRRRVSTLLAA